MKPNPSYVKLQRQLQAVKEQTGLGLGTKELQTELEAKFMTAWHLTPDRLGMAARLRHSLDGLRMEGSRTVCAAEGLDHCSYYTGVNDQRVIVTQPYGYYEAELKRWLTLDEGMSPAIIRATEWAFYSPGKAELIVIRFPFNYGKVLATVKGALRSRTREEINAALPLDRNFTKRLPLSLNNGQYSMC